MDSAHSSYGGVVLCPVISQRYKPARLLRRDDIMRDLWLAQRSERPGDAVPLLMIVDQLTHFAAGVFHRSWRPGCGAGAQRIFHQRSQA